MIYNNAVCMRCISVHTICTLQPTSVRCIKIDLYPVDLPLVMAAKAQTSGKSPVSSWPGLSRRLDVETAKRRYYTEGYVRADTFVTESEISTITKELDRYLSDVVPNLPSEVVFFSENCQKIRLEKMMEHDEFFKDLAESPVFNGIANLLLDTECIPFNVQYFAKTPGNVAIPPHQDCKFFMHNQAITFWLALNDSDTEIGCLYYVPSSNRRGELKHRPHGVTGYLILVEHEDCLKQEIEMSAKAGTLLGHHPYMIHRTGANKSKERTSQTLALTYWAKNIND